MFSKIFIDRPKLAMVISIVMVLLGIICVRQMPVAEYPEIAPPTLMVRASYSGASAQDVADAVAAPIEAEMNGLEDMLYFSSECNNDGSYALNVTMAPGCDTDIAQVNIQNAVKRAEMKLPNDVKQLGINVIKRSSDILSVFAFYPDTKKISVTELGNYLRTNLKDEIARIDGISQVEIMGASEYAMRVWLDPLKMSALGISPDEIYAAISSQNLQAAAGSVGSERSNDCIQLKVNTLGRLNKPEQFQNIVIRATADGRMVHLGDVAKIELGQDDYTWDASIQGTPIVSFALYRNTDANALATVKQARAKIAELSKYFPDGVSYDVAYDPTQYIEVSMEEIVWTLIMTLILVVAITYLFLQNWRATLIPTVAIPVSIMATFAVLYPLGYSLNLLTMFGLILVIGSLVDDAIVVVENVIRLMEEEHLSSYDAAVKSMQQITGAIIATTLVTVAVYAPIAFYGGLVGTIYQQFSVTMCIALCFSTFNAMTLSPALCALIIRPAKPLKIFDSFNKALNFSRNIYLTCTGYLVRRSILTLIIMLAVIASSYGIFQTIFNSFLPAEDKGALLVGIELSPSSTLARTSEVTRKFQQAASQVPGVNRVFIVNGFSFFGGKGENLALAIIDLKKWEERPAPNIFTRALCHMKLMKPSDDDWGKQIANIQAKIQGLANGIAEARINVVQPPAIMGLGASNDATFSLLAKNGQDAYELEAATYKLMGILNNPQMSPGVKMAFSTYNASTPQLYLDINREKAEMLQIPVSTIFSTLQSKLASRYVNDFNLYGYAFKVRMQAKPGERTDVNDLEHINFRSKTGKTVPLKSIASIRYSVGPRSVTRFNQAPSADFNVSGKPGVSSGEITKHVEKVIRENFPGYQMAWTGLAFQEQGNEGKIFYLLIASVVFAYLFLVAQYESWTMPLSVMTSVTVALLGALLGIKIWSMDLSIYSQLGLIMLIGLAGKNAILMAEFSKQAHEDNGMPLEEAAQSGGRVRYRAVLMTAWSFVIGVFPMVIATGAGAGSRTAIGVTTFTGMVMASVFGIITVPPLYAMFQKMREGTKRKVGVTPSSAAGKTE